VSDWSVGFPRFGFLGPVSVAALVEPLRAATSTPEDITIGIWDGWGELSPETMSVFAWFDEPHGSPQAAAKARALKGELRDHRSADQAWCIASEIDFDSTVVGGSRYLIDAILASGLEALAVPEDGDLSENGDRINPKPPH
jgi:hypothetical protein